jgi:hypothetical protein
MSFEDEYVEQYRQKGKNNIAKWLPALGLMLVLALVAIAFVLAEPVHEFVYEQFFFERELENGTAPADSFNQDEMQYVVGGVIFMAMLLFAGFLYALMAPRTNKPVVTERDLKKERQGIHKEKKRAKVRRQKINKQYAKEREEQMRKEYEESRKSAKNRRQ